MSGKITVHMEQKDLMALIMAGKVVTRLWSKEGLKTRDTYSMQRAVDNAFDALTDEMLGYAPSALQPPIQTAPIEGRYPSGNLSEDRRYDSGQEHP